MHDAVLIELFERFKQLSEDDKRLFLSESLPLLEEGLECAAIAVLIYKVEIIGGFKGFDEANDVVVLECRQDVNLVDG